MTLYARLTEDGLVLETCEHDPNECFHPDIAKEFQVIPQGAEPGDSVISGKIVKAVVRDPLPVQSPLEQRLVPRNDFLNALTRVERIAINDVANDDAELKDFLALLEINGHFDLEQGEDIALLDRLQAEGVLSEASVTAIKALK